MNYTDEKITKKPRIYFKDDFDVTNWEEVKEKLEEIINFEVNSANDLIIMLEKAGELSDILSEEMAWRYITMTRYADNPENSKKFNEFYANIVSKSIPYDFKLKKKFYDSPYKNDLDKEKYSHLVKIISNDIELYREENIPLQIKEKELTSKYGERFSKLTVTYKGEEKTLSQLSVYQKDKDRKVREETWRLKMDRMAKEKEFFDNIFDEMKELRIQQAQNAGFDNYRDYMHQAKGRFAYTPQDLIEFHNAVEKEVLPFLKELSLERKEKLKVDKLRPWDTSVDLDGRTLKPYETIDEFIDKAIDILYEIKPIFGIRLNMMKNSGFLDLENRKGKSPGGYNYPLQETGAPFIFMNAVKLHRDIVTLLHESGHAMHTFETKDIKIDAYKDTPSEVAELASMGMEFLSMPHWNKYYPNPEDHKKAQRDQLAGALKFLPWCMIVDSFQHWLYTNPNHTVEERDDYFVSLLDRFSTGIDWSGLEQYKKLSWLFQLHIFEMPFYYIEYGMSQLGALSIYKNLKEKGNDRTLESYINFLRLGYTKPVDQLYKAAGIEFDFSQKHIGELVKFVKKELDNLK